VEASWIVDEAVIYVYPDGQRRRGRIAIGHPTAVTPEEGSCAISLEGYDRLRTPIVGCSPLQALLLAIRLMGSMLRSFIDRGGQVLGAKDGADLQLSVLFGPMFVAEMK
jgi:hypothetical protein